MGSDCISSWSLLIFSLSNFTVNKEEIIIGGDFNFTENNFLDRQDSYSMPSDTSSCAYKTLIRKHNLCDIWRAMHPNRKQFTYKEQSCLDKFIVSEMCSKYILNSYILHSGIRSDHKGIKITFNLTSSKRGPGLWKLNTTVLNESYTWKILKN